MSGGSQQSQGHDLAAEKIVGVFSSKQVKKVGTGSTTRKTIQQSFFYVNQQDDGTIAVQVLNQNFVPSGPKEIITKETLLKEFTPEPEMYFSSVAPRMRELTKTIARADRHRVRGEAFSAEMEYTSALNVDEENVRANFGIGLCYLQRGEKEKAQDVFERLVKLNDAFDPEHKHLINEFGISLRKTGMHQQALEYYTKALAMSANADENIYYNVARACHDMGDLAGTREALRKALEINPDMAEAAKFLKFLDAKP
jgi:tetratricopeptide (TPR) repeat protein